MKTRVMGMYIRVLKVNLHIYYELCTKEEREMEMTCTCQDYSLLSSLLKYTHIYMVISMKDSFLLTLEEIFKYVVLHQLSMASKINARLISFGFPESHSSVLFPSLSG